MNVSFHPEAEAEFISAIEYYEDIKPGLGLDFALEVQSAISRASKYPQAWQELDKNIRRTLVKRFPFGILYSEAENKLFILAVMNLHREPNYWKIRK
jgi:hypothetical protein